MYLKNTHEITSTGKVVRKKHLPLITFTEFANLQNITVAALKAYAGNAIQPIPSPVIVHKNRSTVKNSWYNKKELQAWWDTRISKPSPCKLIKE